MNSSATRCAFPALTFPTALFSLAQKADLGPCRKLHSEPLKDTYDEAVRSGKTFTYERETEEYLQRIVDDLERKMVRSQQRIDEQEARDADATKAIDEEIEKLTQKANELVRLAFIGAFVNV